MSLSLASPSSFTFKLRAQAAPDVLPRVLDFLARRALVPTRFSSRREEAVAGVLFIEFEVTEMAPTLAAYTARCLEQLVNVEWAGADPTRRVMRA